MQQSQAHPHEFLPWSLDDAMAAAEELRAAVDAEKANTQAERVRYATLVERNTSLDADIKRLRGVLGMVKSQVSDDAGA